VRVSKHEIHTAIFTSAVSVSSLLFLILLLSLLPAAPAQAQVTTPFYISSGGGDCAAIGSWDAATSTCTLTTDISFAGTNGIVISSNGITLDGNGHTISGDQVGYMAGVSMAVRNNVTVRNMTITGFTYGVYLLSSSNNEVINNDFIGNTTQAYVVGGAGNAFDLPSTGGNYWDDFDQSAEGCDDFNGDYVCDAAYSFSGGQDNMAWKLPDGWTLTPPPDNTPPTITGVQPSGTIGVSATTVSVDYHDDGTGIDTAAVLVTLDGNPLPGCSASQTNVSCPVSGLAPGSHTIGGSVADNAGNTAPVSGSFIFTDTTPPTVSNLRPAGTINTTDTTLAADLADDTGSGIDTATVSVTLDGSPVSGCTVTAATVSCAVNGLGEGTHAMNVSADDMAGNSASAGGSFDVDSVAPSVTGVQPAGDITTPSALITVSYSDAVSGIDTSSVSVTLDGSPLASCAVDSAGASCPASGLTLGAHTIGGSVADNAGNTSAISGGFSFVDNTAPSLGNLAPDGIINTTDPVLSADYSDGGSGIDTTTVSVTLDGSPVSGCTVTASAVNCATTGLAEGLHSLSVSVADMAGNAASGSSSFTIDTAAPTITPTVYISDNAVGGDCGAVGVWDDATKTCTLSGSLNFDGTGIVIGSNGVTLDGNGYSITGAGGKASGVVLTIRNNVTVKNLTITGFKYGVNILSSSNITVYNNNFYDNTTQVGLSGGSGNSFNLPAPDGGNYWSDYDTPAEGCSDGNGDGFCDAPYVFAGGQDDLPWTGPKQVVDTTPPTVFNIQPAGDVNTSAPTLSAGYSDAGGSAIDTASVAVTLDGSPVSGCSATATGVSCPSSGLAEGPHNLSVSVSDNAGNNGSGNGSFSVDSVSPVVTSVLPTGTINTDYTTVSIDYFDAGSGVDASSVSVELDGNPLSGCIITAGSAGCDVVGLSPGAHSIGGSVADMAGNVSSISGSFDVVAPDTTPPTVSNLSPSGVTGLTSATISADYSDSSSGIDTTSVAVTLDGSPVSGCTVTTTSVSCPVSGLADGSHAYAVSVSDNAGNNASGNGSFAVDTAAPTVISVLPAGSIATSSTTINVSYVDAVSGVDTASVAITLDGNQVSGCTVTSGSASCPVSSLSFGAHSIGGSVADLIGNTASISGGFSYVDTDAPVVTNLTPTGTISTSDTVLAADYSDSGSGIDTASVAVTLDGSPVSGCTVTATSVSCPVSGLADGSHSYDITVADNVGNAGSAGQSFSVDTTVAINVPTIYLTTSATGGDCEMVGTWDSASKTCTLANNLSFNGTNGIVISSNGITIDGAGYQISGNGGYVSGVSMVLKSNITIRNLTIRNFNYGINMLSSSNVSVYYNNFVDNATQAYVVGGSGNSFNMPLPDGGNYWNDYDTPTEGCDDINGDLVCDAAYSFPGGQDNLPWAYMRQAVDTLPPSITGLQPSGAIATTATTLSAGYVDGGSGVDSASVAVYLDGSPVSGCTVVAASVSCPVSGLSEGSHSFTVQVADLLGNAGSATSPFTVDTGAPVVSSVQPSGTISSDSATIAAYYSDSVSGVDNASVSLTLDGNPLSGCVVTASSASCEVYGLAGGPHTIGGSVADLAGNVTPISGGFTVSITDTTPPAITNLQPAGTINTAAATLSADYSDSGSGIDTGSVAVTLDGSPVSGCMVSATSVSCPVSGLADGSHAFTVSVSDNDANSALAGGSFTVDTVSPTVDSISPTGFVTSSAATIAAYYSDATGSIDTASVSVYLDGSPLSGCTVTAASASCDVYGMPEGNHTVDVSVSDTGGNTGNGSGQFTVDTVAPAVDSVSPSGYINTADATVQVYYSDATSGIDTSAAVMVYMNGPVTGALPGCTVTASDVSCPVTGLTDGDYTIDVRVYDNAGNEGYYVAAGSFTVDTVVPAILSVSPNGWQASDSATVVAYYQDLGSGVDTSAVSVDVDGVPLSGCSITVSSASCDVYGLAEGSHVISVTVADNAGNVSAEGSLIGVDLTPPVITNLTPTGTTNRTSFTVSADYTDSLSYVDSASLVAYMDGSQMTGCALAGTTFNCAAVDLPAGAHTIDVYISDNVGNTAHDSGTITIDTSVPPLDSTATITLLDNFDGGDCTIYGLWDWTSKTCTLVTNLDITGASNGIVLNDSGITLDGDGYTMTGSGGNSSGLVTAIKSGITVRNLTVDGFKNGLYFISATNATVYNNNFLSNTNQVVLSGGSGNLFNLGQPEGGNHWSDYDTPAEGCDDVNGDGICDAPYLFAGGQDDLPWAAMDGWTLPPPGDTIPPAITNIQPTGMINTADTTISAYYSDAGSGIDSATVAVYLDGAPVSGCSVTASDVSCPVTGLGQGSHTIEVWVDDNAGNTGSGSSDVFIDAVLYPGTNLVLPEGWQNSSSAVLRVYFDDDGSGIDPGSFSINLDGLPVSGCDVTATDASCNVYGLSEGHHAIDGWIADNAGNGDAFSGGFDVDTTAPFVGGLTPGGNMATNSPTLTAMYSDAGSGIDTSTVTIVLDGAPVSGCTVNAGDVSCPTSGLAEGSHWFNATASDMTGNTTTSATVAFIVDTVAPYVTDVLPSGTISTADATIKVYYADDTIGVDTDSVQVTLDGTPLSGCAVTATGATCDVYGLADGAHVIGGTLTDLVGNMTVISGGFTVSTGPPPDTTAPVVTSVSPSGAITMTNAPIEVYYNDGDGDGIDPSSVSVTVDGTPLTGCDITTAYASCTAYGLSEGAHTIGGSVADLAGNTTPISGSFTYEAPACTTRFVDINGAAVAVYSDPGYSASVCQYDSLSPNTDYYIQVEHPSLDLSSQGTNRNRLRLRDLADNSVNFGDGSSEVAFTQQPGGPPYVYRATFRTPSASDAYSLEVELENSGESQLIKVRGYAIMIVGSGSYLKTFSDAGYSVQTDTFGAADTVYIEIYSPGLANTTPGLSQSRADVADFLDNKVSRSFDSVSRPAARTYRMALTLPGTAGDKAIRLDLKSSGGSRISRAGFLVNVQ